ncbi:hypothetical protein BJY52DRAFT_1190723 [Lactarius psammicola]|nr:hypothetical protein BJY52DRAFT_1190723 [Lactarius psammicola]
MRHHWLSVLFALTVAPFAGLAISLVQVTKIDFHTAPQPQNENALIDALYEVSTPRRTKYGSHFSKEEVAKLVEPHPDTL